MTTRLLQTKLFRPPLRPQRTPRPRLIQRLNHGLDSGAKLTSLSAPTGFGKTSLLLEWIDGLARPTAWFALDEGDNDPSRFLSYLLAALQQNCEQLGAKPIGQSIGAALQSPTPPALEASMVTLINELSALDQPSALVLDDYHEIHEAAIHRALTLLLDHMPHRFHLIIASRVEPPLPLALLRARAELTEIDSAALRFSLDETNAFLNQTMQLQLTVGDVAHLEARTEGWIASLQLAALSLRGRDDAHAFVQTFAGNNRHVMDYLLGEVLERQPGYIRDFLLHTSILPRLNVELCNAVTEQVGSQQILDDLEQNNLFVSPLDDRREWYRYHPLFAEFLRARLRRVAPESERTLHLRASQWCEQAEQIEEAIDHALAAGDQERAARLIEQIAFDLIWKSGRVGTLLRWSKQVVPEVRRHHPELMLAAAWALYSGGNWGALQTQLAEIDKIVAERRLHKSDRLLGQMLVLRAEYAIFQGEIAQAQTLLAEAAVATPSRDPAIACLVAQARGFVARLQGDVVGAEQALQLGVHLGRETGNLAAEMFSLVDLAEVRLIEGRLSEAAEIYAEMLRIGGQPGQEILSAACGAYIGLGQLAYLRNDLAAAAVDLETGLDLARQSGIRGFQRTGSLFAALTQQAAGNTEVANEQLGRAMETARQSQAGWIVDQVKMFAARFALLHGDLVAAARWAASVAERSDEQKQKPNYLRHQEEILRSSVLLRQGDAGQAAAHFDERRAIATANGWPGSLVEIGIGQALCAQALEAEERARVAFSDALSRAQREGVIRPFLDAGEPMRRLLETARAQPGAASNTSAFAEQLLSALDKTIQNAPISPNTSDTSPPTPLLAEPLTEREMEILGLIAEGLSNRLIGERLFIAVGTVGKHTSNIFVKLDAANRAAAVLRARELGLL